MSFRLTIFIASIIFIFTINESLAQCGSCNKCDDFPNSQFSTHNSQLSTNASELMNSKNENDDEFDEFTDFNEGKEQINSQNESKPITHKSQLPTVLLALSSVIVAGILVRFKWSRNLRPFFMIGFLIYLGFYLGACPCPISAYQNVFLAAFGKDIRFESMLYFIGLIPITYVFGKVWCGWICHLGTLQELLHLHRKINLFKEAKSQKIMRTIRWILFFGLIIQLAITQTNWFCKVDPFLVAFNFISVYSIGWYLLGLLIISSIFIHRPFCQTACPIGVVLGWIGKIPGASVLNFNENCIHCNTCYGTCKIGAITKDNGNHFLNKQECNLCGECLDSCEKNATKFIRK